MAKLSGGKSIKPSLDHSFYTDKLGTHCVHKYHNYRCGKCPTGNKNFPIKEERELEMIENSLTLDSSNNKWNAAYPWKQTPNYLPNNYVVAFARLLSTERRLRRVGGIYMNQYGDQIAGMVERHVARKVTKSEIMNYTGPVHGIPHQEVMKPDSETTPIRIVFNSSSPCMGRVLNEYWAKGPNIVNDMVSALTRFRQVGDISKMCNSVAITDRDAHMHGFLWMDMDSTRGPDHYILQTETFGDRPSGTIEMLALHKTADMLSDVYLHACEMTKENSHVDGLLMSVDSMDEARKLACGVETVLENGGFLVKHEVSSSKELNGVACEWNLDKIKNDGRRNGMGWLFSKSADYPWQNGCSEALVKSVERDIQMAVGANVLAFSELQTEMFQTANCLNERPIGRKYTDPEDGSYLCPNDLLLGSGTSRVFITSCNQDVGFLCRWKFVQQIADLFGVNGKEITSHLEFSGNCHKSLRPSLAEMVKCVPHLYDTKCAMFGI